MPTGGRGRFPWEGHLGATSREKPLPQKRVVLSRTLRTAAPLSGYVQLSHIRMPEALLPMPSSSAASASAQLERPSGARAKAVSRCIAILREEGVDTPALNSGE